MVVVRLALVASWRGLVVVWRVVPSAGCGGVSSPSLAMLRGMASLVGIFFGVAFALACDKSALTKGRCLVSKKVYVHPDGVTVHYHPLEDPAGWEFRGEVNGSESVGRLYARELGATHIFHDGGWWRFYRLPGDSIPARSAAARFLRWLADRLER